MKTKILAIILVGSLFLSGALFAGTTQEFFPDEEWPDQEFDSGQQQDVQGQQQESQATAQESGTQETQPASADAQSAQEAQESKNEKLGPIEEKGWYGQTADKPWYWQVDKSGSDTKPKEVQ